MDQLSSLCLSIDETNSDKEFQAFKHQLEKVQNLIYEYNSKIVDKSLCADDLANMKTELSHMMELEQDVTSEKMRTIYVSYKRMSLRLVQESYHICNWLMEEGSNELDNIFDIDTFIGKIFEACAGQEDPLGHMNTVFKNVLKNTNYFNLHFDGNIKLEETDEPIVSTQLKREYRKSQKRVLEDLVVPDEVENDTGDSELKITLVRVLRCLKQAISRNNGEPVSFYKFAIDPFSLSFTVENIFNLASLVKDNFITIDRDDKDEFTTITVAKKKKSDDRKSRKDDVISSLFTINENLWKHYIQKYNITERMIEQVE